jgi:Recombination endonuclease VII
MPLKDLEKRREYNREYSTTHPDQMREYKRKYYAANRDAILLRRRERSKTKPGAERERHLFRRYGLTPNAWDTMFDGQGQRCAICRGESRRWDTDHDHNTGEVRGILCGPCNRAIGLLKDSPEVVTRAAEYLKR